MLNNFIYSVLLVLNTLISSMYCMTPSQTMAELMSGSVGSTISSSSLSSLYSTSGSSSSLGLSSLLSWISLPEFNSVMPDASELACSHTLSSGASSSRSPAMLTANIAPSSTVSTLLIPRNSLVVQTANASTALATTTSLEKSEILSKLMKLAKSSAATEPNLKKARVATESALVTQPTSDSPITQPSLVGNQVLNIPALSNLIIDYGVGSARDVANFTRINKTFSTLLSSDNLKNLLSKIKNPHITLDIAALKNYVYIIDKYFDQYYAAREEEIRKSGQGSPKLWEIDRIHCQIVEGLQYSSVKYRSLPVIRNLCERNIRFNFEHGSLLFNQMNNITNNRIILFILSNTKQLFDACHLLFSHDSNFATTILHAAIRANNTELFKNILELVKLRLKDTLEYKQLINMKDRVGGNILHICVRTNNIEALKIALNYCMDITQTDKFGKTPMLIACEKNNTHMVDLLLDAINKQPESLISCFKPDHYTNTPLSYSLQYNNIKLTERLLLLNPTVHREGIGKTLILALLQRNIALFERLINLYLEKTDIINECLREACKFNNIEFDVIKYLVEKLKADPNAHPTLIHFIIHNHNHRECFQILRYLIDHGASINKTFSITHEPSRFWCSGREATMSAIDQALGSKNTEIIKLLLENTDSTTLDNMVENATFINDGILKSILQLGANPKIKNSKGQTPLHIYLEEGDQNEKDFKIIDTLVEFGCKVNEQDNFGNTPLFYAVLLDLDQILQCVKVLVKNGADLEHKNKNGETYINHLVKKSFRGIDIIIEVINLGCKLDTIDLNGNTPLHNIILYSRYPQFYNNEEDRVAKLKSIKLLINNGSNVQAKNCLGDTTLHVLILNLDKIVYKKSVVGDKEEQINLDEFIKLFAPAINIKNNAGRTAFDLANLLLNTEKYRTDIEERNILLKIIELIKPTE